MVGEIMRYIRNYFLVPGGRHTGIFTISNGTIDLPFLDEGQWFLIEGSRRNGRYRVCRYPEDGLTDERFKGSIIELNPDPDFLELCQEIEEWQEKYGNQVENGPIVSESFDGYSYSKGTNSSGVACGWKDIYKDRLNTWRRL